MELLTNKTDYNANIAENNPNKAGFFEGSIFGGVRVGGWGGGWRVNLVSPSYFHKK